MYGHLRVVKKSLWSLILLIDDKDKKLFAVISKETAELMENIKGLEHGDTIGVTILGFLNQIVILKLASGVSLSELTEAMEYFLAMLRNITKAIDDQQAEVASVNAEEIDWENEFNKEFKDT